MERMANLSTQVCTSLFLDGFRNSKCSPVFLETSHVEEWKDQSVASMKRAFTGRQKQEAEADDDDDDDFDLGKLSTMLMQYARYESKSELIPVLLVNLHSKL